LYENPFLQTIYQYKKTGINPTAVESRIHLLYVLLSKKIMPWMWDYDNYPLGKDDEMYGQFYPEDLAAITQIMYFEGESK